MNEITTVGIDLAKHVFAVHAVSRDGRLVLRRTVSRSQGRELQSPTRVSGPVSIVSSRAAT